MRIKEIKLYQFDELSDAAKEKARAWYRECNAFDNCFAEAVYDDAANVADLFGLDIRQRRVTFANGNHSYEPAIYYSGFWSQGDGACFEGYYQYKKGALKAVKEYAPRDTELHGIVARIQKAQARIFYSGTASTRHSGHYYHSGCMSVSAECDERFQQSAFPDWEDTITDELRAFADWIYSRLEDAWEWENEDEQVDESIRANGYEFTEDGERA